MLVLSIFCEVVNMQVLCVNKNCSFLLFLLITLFKASKIERLEIPFAGDFSV